MRHFDLHADTLSKCLKNKKSLIHNDFAISVERGLIFDEWVQVFAAFVPDEYHGSKGYHRFLLEADQLTRAFEESDRIVPYDKDNVRPGVCNAMLAVEGGSAMGGKVSRIDDLYNMGVRMFSLCWNGETDLAGGTASEMGLTTLGKEAVR